MIVKFCFIPFNTTSGGGSANVWGFNNRANCCWSPLIFIVVFVCDIKDWANDKIFCVE